MERIEIVPRVFARAWAWLERPWHVFAAWFAAVALTAVPALAQERAEARGDVVYRVPVQGTIELGLAPFIQRSLGEADAAGASAVILDIDTPGGRLDAAQQIVDAIKASEVPVFAFVNPRAFSAGAMIALATDGIYMAPGAVLGAATPVTGDGDKAPEKIVSAMRAEMRGLAEARGLDPRVAEAMVDEEIAIDGVTEAGKLLTLTSSEAAALGYATEVASWDALTQVLGIDGSPVIAAEINWAESLVRFFTNPLVAPMLLSLGFLGLLVELKTPAFGLAGLAGLASLALFFGSHYLVGLAGWEELILLGAGLVLLGIEIFIVPGFGIFGIAGSVAVLAGIYLSLLGQFAVGTDFSQAAMVLSASILLVLVGGWVLVRTLTRNGRLERSGFLMLSPATKESGWVSAAARTDLVGAAGVAVTDLRPAGIGQFGDERLDVVSEGAWIPAGTAIRLIRSEGYRHVVRAEG